MSDPLGRPYRQVPGEQALPNFLHKKFRQACAWSSFTIDRNNTAWKYKTFICKYKTFICKYKTFICKYKTFICKYKTFICKYKTFICKYKTFICKYKTFICKYKTAASRQGHIIKVVGHTTW